MNGDNGRKANLYLRCQISISLVGSVTTAALPSELPLHIHGAVDAEDDEKDKELPDHPLVSDSTMSLTRPVHFPLECNITAPDSHLT